MLGAGHALLTRNILREMKYPVEMVFVMSDSTGAKGVAMRMGVRKIRHLDARHLDSGLLQARGDQNWEG